MQSTTIQTSVLESRFSFANGRPIDGPALAATPDEIDRARYVGERSRIRRRTKEMTAPGYDGNAAARVLMQIRVFEKRTAEHPERQTIVTVRKDGRRIVRQVRKYYRGGRLGRVSIDLCELLMWFGRKHGRIFPSLKKLAQIMHCCVDTIIDALNRLIEHGFVIKHRRSRLITTADGPRWVQDSNAYSIQAPDADTGAGRLLCLLGLLTWL